MMTISKVLLAVTILSACGDSKTMPTNRIKIDSGEFVGADSANKVDGVFFSVTASPGSQEGNACTGTAVSTTTAMTAGHCVFRPGDRLGPNGELVGKQYCISNAIHKNLCSVLIFVNPQYPNRAHDAGGGVDSAFVVFPEAPFQAIFKLETTPLTIGDSVLLVGYSQRNLQRQDKGSKRFGYNRVASLLSREQNDIVTNFTGNFQGVGVSPGDSGGPIFKGCQIAGVASRMSQNSLGQKIGLHTNLTFNNTAQFLKNAKIGYFCGLSGNDERYCPAAKLYQYRSDLWAKSQEFPCQLGEPSASGGSQNSNPSSVPTVFALLSEQEELRIRGTIALSSVTVCLGRTRAIASACTEKLASNASASDFVSKLQLPVTESEYFASIEAMTSNGQRLIKLIKLTRR